MYRIEYRSARGWWTGAQAMEIKDIRDYIARVNANGRPARAIDLDTGEIIGEPCSLCGDAHPGLDGECLL